MSFENHQKNLEGMENTYGLGLKELAKSINV